MEPKQRKIRWLLLMFIFMLAVSSIGYEQMVIAAEGEPSAKIADAPAEPSEIEQLGIIYQWGWVRQEWAEDKNDLSAVRQSLEQLFEENFSETHLQQLVLTHRTEAKKEPKNLLKQFKWAFVSYKAALLYPSFGNKELFEAKEVLIKREPLTYEEARLRFLIEARNFPFARLQIIGERLTKHDPKDYEVKFYLVGVLDPSRSEAERQKAVSYAQELVEMHPNKPSVYTVLGGTYYASWLRTRLQVEADQAIAAYEKYLEMAPENDRFRKQAQKLIDSMRTPVSQKEPAK